MNFNGSYQKLAKQCHETTYDCNGIKSSQSKITAHNGSTHKQLSARGACLYVCACVVCARVRAAVFTIQSRILCSDYRVLGSHNIACPDRFSILALDRPV